MLLECWKYTRLTDALCMCNNIACIIVICVSVCNCEYYIARVPQCKYDVIAFLLGKFINKLLTDHIAVCRQGCRKTTV